jgi:hypothetical protein
MLEDGELSPWVQTIFAGFKAGTFWRCVMQYSAITSWLVGNLLFNSKQVRVKQWENFEYCQSRMDNRLAHEPAHSDLWSKILSKSDSAERLNRDEYHSNAVTFMVAGKPARVWAMRFHWPADRIIQGPRLLLRRLVVLSTYFTRPTTGMSSISSKQTFAASFPVLETSLWRAWPILSTCTLSSRKDSGCTHRYVLFDSNSSGNGLNAIGSESASTKNTFRRYDNL